MAQTIETLNTTQALMVAASLEIDGRARRAAMSSIGGHITEFTYSHGAPFSPKAIRLEALTNELEAVIQDRGITATVAALRS